VPGYIETPMIEGETFSFPCISLSDIRNFKYRSC
jgi:hypothetical protein